MSSDRDMTIELEDCYQYPNTGLDLTKTPLSSSILLIITKGEPWSSITAVSTILFNKRVELGSDFRQFFTSSAAGRGFTHGDFSHMQQSGTSLMKDGLFKEANILSIEQGGLQGARSIGDHWGVSWPGRTTQHIFCEGSEQFTQ